MGSSFFSKKELYDWYISDELSTYQIAKKRHCDPKTVYHWLKKYQILTRKRKVIFVDKLQLESLYKKGLSMREIGIKFNLTPAAIFRKMKGFNLTSRTTWDANIIHERHDFSRDLIEKAYLIGFRIGDLNITRRSDKSSIVIKTNTTHKVQVSLMENLFK